LEAPVIRKMDKINIESKRENDAIPPVLQISPPEILPLLKIPENILVWFQAHVHD
jgi:hypothetical protein